MGLGDRVSNLVAFLRSRYPAGAPAVGYAPLLALLPRRISEEEISVIVGKLSMLRRRSIGRADAGVEITRVTDRCRCRMISIESEVDSSHLTSRGQRAQWRVQPRDDGRPRFFVDDHHPVWAG